MKEELHLNKLTHLEKVDIYVANLRELKKNHKAHWGQHGSIDSKIYIKLINMMHDYEEYCDALADEIEFTEYDYKKSKYVQEIKRLYIEVEGHRPEFSNKLFNTNRKLEEEADATLSSLHFRMMEFASFIGSGKRIFKISNSLIHGLDNTNCNTDVSYIRTPYNTIYIQFPPSFASGNSWNQRINDSVVTQYKKGFGAGVDGAYVSIENGHMKYLLVPRVKFDIKNIMKMDMISTSCTPSQIPLDKKVTIKEIVNMYKAHNNNFSSSSEYVLITIIKILMYLSSIDIDTEIIYPPINNKTNKKKKLKKQKTTLPYKYVGGNIIINNHNNFENSSGNGTGRQITTKFMVRGHYHGFWMNLNDDFPNHQILDIKDDKMLVRKWVEPFWKGSEFAEVVLKDYKVN